MKTRVSLDAFLLKEALYKEYQVSPEVSLLLEFHRELVTFCRDCGRDSAFESITSLPHLFFSTGPKAMKSPEELAHAAHARLRMATGMRAEEGMKVLEYAKSDRLVVLRFDCRASRGHAIIIVLRFAEGGVQKIGQFPSLADLAEYDVEKYKTVLPAVRFRELRQALVLRSFGFGVASFVHFRRLLEREVDEAHARALSVPAWDNAAYQQARFAEKVKLLEQFLPPFTDSAAAYAILSKGLHELTEDECIAIFPVLNDWTRSVLDEKLRMKERERTSSSVKALGAQLSSRKKRGGSK